MINEVAVQQTPTAQAQPSNNIISAEEEKGEGREELALFNTTQAMWAATLLVLLLCTTTANYHFGARACHHLGQITLPL